MSHCAKISRRHQLLQEATILSLLFCGDKKEEQRNVIKSAMEVSSNSPPRAQDPSGFLPASIFFCFTCQECIAHQLDTLNNNSINQQQAAGHSSAPQLLTAFAFRANDF
jgi:hypothetical protein